MIELDEYTKKGVQELQSERIKSKVVESMKILEKFGSWPKTKRSKDAEVADLLSEILDELREIKQLLRDSR
jgi:hypothetical protein